MFLIDRLKQTSWEEQSEREVACFQHKNRLTCVETSHGLNLSESRAIDQKNIGKVYGLMKTFDSWLWKKYGHTCSGEFLVLTPKDHRSLALKVGSGLDSKKWEVLEEIPAGSNLALKLDRESDLSRRIPIITYFEPDSQNPNAACPIEAVVAEEIFHRASRMRNPEYLADERSAKISDLAEVILSLEFSEDRYKAEEIGVKYYVDKALWDNGFWGAATKFREIKGIGKHFDTWKQFEKEVGVDEAQRFFFVGYGLEIEKNWRIFKNVFEKVKAVSRVSLE